MFMQYIDVIRIALSFAIFFGRWSIEYEAGTCSLKQINC